MTLLVAGACTILFATPSFVAVPVIVFLNTLTPALLTCSIIYRKGTLRTFCIGASFPAGLLLFTTGLILAMLLSLPAISLLRSLDDLINICDILSVSFRASAGAAWFMMVVIGSLAVAFGLPRPRSDEPREEYSETSIDRDSSDLENTEVDDTAI